MGSGVAAIQDLVYDRRVQAADIPRIAGHVSREDERRVAEFEGLGGRGLGREAPTANQDIGDPVEDSIAGLRRLGSAF